MSATSIKSVVSAKASNVKDVVTLDRRRGDDRRGVAANDSAVDPRRKTQRRRHIDPTTCEREYNDQEVSFMRAMDDYKRTSGRMFPTCSEVLEVIRSMGYVQLTEDQLNQLGIDPNAPVEDSSFDPNAEEE